MGYNLQDCGNHWRTNALYRGGSNPTALMIYKDSGVWTDFVKNTPRMPFKDLISATLKSTDQAILNDFLAGLSNNSATQPKPKMSSEKIYPISILEKLMPHYVFYTKKGIKEDVLVNLKGGLATEGAMYQRFVFPIFNQHKMIHGFSGRDMNPDSSNRPKWKHIGKKSSWIYPAYVPIDGDLFFYNSIIKSKSVYLVESIGDVLSLHSAGIYNVLCIFGTSISSKQVCGLLSLGLENIFISLNNDQDKDKNRGLIGSLGVFCKLLNYFSKEKICITPPTSNDFGDMSEDSINDWVNKKDKCLSLELISDYVNQYFSSGDISKVSYQIYKKYF